MPRCVHSCGLSVCCGGCFRSCSSIGIGKQFSSESWSWLVSYFSINQRRNPVGIECPKCNSDQVQAIKVILESGTIKSTGSFTGAGSTFGSGRPGMVVGSSSSVSQTNLAASLSAPPKGKIFPVIFLGLLFVICALTAMVFLSSQAHDRGFGYFWLFLAAIAGVSIWFLLEKYKTMSRNYREQYPTWQKFYGSGFYCHRCGNKYLV